MLPEPSRHSVALRGAIDGLEFDVHLGAFVGRQNFVAIAGADDDAGMPAVRVSCQPESCVSRCDSATTIGGTDRNAASVEGATDDRLGLSSTAKTASQGQRQGSDESHSIQLTIRRAGSQGACP